MISSNSVMMGDAGTVPVEGAIGTVGVIGEVGAVAGSSERESVVIVAQELAEALVARIVQARARLADAAASADLAGISSALDELEDAYGLAGESGVVIPRPDAHRPAAPGQEEHS